MRENTAVWLRRLSPRDTSHNHFFHIVAIPWSERCIDFHLLISIMGCCMATYQRESDKEMAAGRRRYPPDDKNSTRDSKTPREAPDYFSSLPDELLVKIISLLPETHDRVKFRYVSRRLQKISETPSLWREVVWRDYSSCEEKRSLDVMKAVGIHIKQLSFFQHLIYPLGTLPKVSQTTIKPMKISEMAKILHYCSNLTHLSLPVLDYSESLNDPDDQLWEAIQQMKYLEVLKVYCCSSYQPYLKLKMALKELTVNTVIRSEKNMEGFQNWMMNGFKPPNLNIIILNSSINTYSALIMLREFLLAAWPKWNVRVPTGHTACLKLYISYKPPLNLFQNAPVFQLRYGEIATFPFVQARNLGIDECFLLTDHSDSGKMIRKAKIYSQGSFSLSFDIHDHKQGILQSISNVNVTELDLTKSNLDFKQIINACPQLQRLNLHHNTVLRLEDLQMIATCCCNLQGLNLKGTLITDFDFFVKVWEILSSMNLTHLSMDTSLYFGSLDDVQEKQLVPLFKQCTKLRALELFNFATTTVLINSNLEMLLHFPSLEYLRLNGGLCGIICIQEVLTACSTLRCFYCSEMCQLSSSAYNNLQQLYILSKDTDLNDNFMDTVSAHGGLIHVFFLVHSMTVEGITTLINNSPHLLTVVVGLCERKEYKENYFVTLNASLGKKFAHRKLFTSGLSLIRQMDRELMEYANCLLNTDLLMLWPSELYIEHYFPFGLLISSVY